VRYFAGLYVVITIFYRIAQYIAICATKPIVPIEVYWIWYLFNYIEEKEFIDVLKSSLAGMALIFPCIFIGFKISFLQLSEFEKGRH
jgi:hypothetical protein